MTTKNAPAQQNTGDLANYLPSQQMRFDELIRDGVVPLSKVTGDPTLVEDKDTLIGKRFIIVDFNVRPGSYQRQDGTTGDFISVVVRTQDDELLVFNDGGTGILGQLDGVELNTPILCPKGLRKSEYDSPYGPATTYYLA